MFGETDSDEVARLAGGLAAVGIITVTVTLVIGALAAGAAMPAVESASSPDDSDIANPATVAQDANVSLVQGRLAQQIQERLQNQATNLSRSQVDGVRQSLSDREVKQLLNRYSDIADDSDTQDQSTALAQLSQTQQRFSAQLDRYWELTATYENVTANESGVTERVRRVARSMESTQQALNQTGQTLISQYQNQSSATDANYTAAIGSVRESLANVSRRQRAVRQRVFTPTQFEGVVKESREISVTNPLTVSGRLVTEAMEPVSNATITLQTGTQTIETTTGQNGEFTLWYRPTRLPLGTDQLQLRYTPNITAPYLSADAPIPISISQRRPDIDLTVNPETVRYGESLSLQGTIEVSDTPVPTVPYIVTLGDRVLFEGQTTADGTFANTTTLPAEITPGTRLLTVRVPLRNQTIAGTSATVNLTVKQRPTTITLHAAQVAERSVRVRGSLDVPAGDPVAGRTVTILANGTSVATLETNATGQFASTVLIPEELGSGADGPVSVNMTAVFDEQGTDLAPAQQSRTASVAGSGSQLPLSLPGVLLPVGIVAVALGLVLGYFVWRRDPFDWRDGATTADEEDLIGGQRDEETRQPAVEGSTDAETLLDIAFDDLAADRPERAVRTGYAALRTRLEPVIEHDGGTQTHWEFYRAYEQTEQEEIPLATLRRLTELYEQVTFAGQSVSGQMVREALAPLRESRNENSTRSSGD